MMKKTTFLFIAYALTFSVARAQNLVPNPGFEIQDTCPAVSQISKAQPWVSATMGTPDLYNSTCSTQNLAAHTGIGSSGVFVFNTFANNREYMEAPLTSPLAAGQTYQVSFYVKRLNYRYATDRIGAHFHVGNFYQNTTNMTGLTPQVDHAAGVILGGTSWQLVSGNFVASGGEDHIVIGSFATDANTDTVVANSSSTSKVAYYAIDDISVTAGVGINENLQPDDLISLYPNPARENITVFLPQESRVTNLQVINELGEVVKKIESPAFENGTFQVSTEGISPGIYFVTAVTDQGRATKKISVLK